MNKIKVIENFVSEEDCILAIDLIESSELTNFKNNSLAKIAPATDEVTQLVKKYSDKSLNVHKEIHNLTIPIYTHEGFLTVWNVGAHAGVHMDNHTGAEFVQLSSVLYFNDDFDGGEIYFPEFDFVHKPKAGDGIFFPAFTKEHAYMHGVTKVTSGKRYTMGLWHTQYEERADKDLI